MTFSPSVAIGAPGGFADDVRRVQFPFILKAGEMYVFPTFGVRVPEVTDRVLTVAVGLGAGRPVRAKVLDVAALRPYRIDVPEEYGWNISVREAWVHPAFAPVADPIAPGSRSLTVLTAAAADFIDDLSLLRDTPEIIAIRDSVSEVRDHVMANGNVPYVRLQHLRELLDGGGAVMTLLASAQRLDSAVDAALSAIVLDGWFPANRGDT